MNSAAFETSVPEKMAQKKEGRNKKNQAVNGLPMLTGLKDRAVISHVAKDTCQSKTISRSVLDGEREDTGMGKWVCFLLEKNGILHYEQSCKVDLLVM